MQFILLAAFMCCANTENNFPFAADTAMASVRLLSQVIVLSLMLPACSEPRQDLRLRYATQLDTARPVAAFQLRAQDDSEFTNDNLLGHWSLIFSGFTFCPDICPLTLGQLQAAEQQMTGPRRHHFCQSSPNRHGWLRPDGQRRMAFLSTQKLLRSFWQYDHFYPCRLRQGGPQGSRSDRLPCKNRRLRILQDH